jgi:hypothetical protein
MLGVTVDMTVSNNSYLFIYLFLTKIDETLSYQSNEIGMRFFHVSPFFFFFLTRTSKHFDSQSNKMRDK